LVNLKTDWGKFQEDISNNIQLNVPVRTIRQLNLEAENVMEQIQQAAWKNTPEIKILLARNNYSVEIRQLLYFTTILYHKEHPPEVWHILPGTPCMYIYIYIYIYI
jgi:hypothetical protein